MVPCLTTDNKDIFIENNKSFVYSAANSICKRKLHWENDDELSIALIAFHKAIETYNDEKGNFYSYAKVIIRNSIIDYYRKNSRNTEITINDEDNFNYIDVKNSLNKYEIEKENFLRAEEIKVLVLELENYSISIEDLVQNSPNHKDTKESLLQVAYSCCCNDEIINYIKKNKMLPIKQINLITNTKRKFIENWRKYLISIILILSNPSYIYIRSYLDLKVGEK